jgi:hypothetical protein
VRRRLLDKAELFKSPRLLTLTVDRANFTTPFDAWRHVTTKKLLPKLMRFLGIKIWAWVLEFQRKTGAGWPHWHILIDVADLPGERVDLEHAWRLWRDRWKVGGVDLSRREAEFKNSEHAVMYITKYLTKEPVGGYPVWVLKSSRTIRFVQGCRALGPLVAKPEDAAEDDDDTSDEEEEATGRRGRRPLLDRMSRCNLSAVAWYRRIDYQTGEQHLRRVGTLPVSPNVLVQLQKLGQLEVGIEQRQDAFGRSEFVVQGTYSTLVQALGQCSCDLSTHRVIAERRRWLLDQNMFQRRAVRIEIMTGDGKADLQEASSAGANERH